MEIQYFSQINREDIGRPRGKFPSAWPSWKKPSTISKLHANPPRASLITIHRRMEGNKERKGTEEGKKRFFSSSTLALPPSILASIAPSPLGRECGWMNSIVIESHPHFTNGKASLPPAKSLHWTCIFPFDTPQRSPDFIKNPRNLVPSLPSSAKGSNLSSRCLYCNPPSASSKFFPKARRSLAKFGRILFGSLGRRILNLWNFLTPNQFCKFVKNRKNDWKYYKNIIL